jgi:hypothetical protein
VTNIGQKGPTVMVLKVRHGALATIAGSETPHCCQVSSVQDWTFEEFVGVGTGHGVRAQHEGLIIYSVSASETDNRKPRVAYWKGSKVALDGS